MIGRLVRLGRGAARLALREIKERTRRSEPHAEQPAPPEHAERARSAPEQPRFEPVPEVDVKTVAGMFERGEPFQLLDCRELHEWEAGYIDGCVHIPMNDLPERIAELDQDAHTVVYCLHGIRSAEVAAWLHNAQGFARVASMEGGIVSWYSEMNQERIVVTRSEEI